MLHNTHTNPHTPQRVVILGSSGFIGAAIMSAIKKTSIPNLGISSKDLNFLAENSSIQLASILRPTDTLIFVSAKAPVKNTTMLIENLRMAENITKALQYQPVNHLIYISSDAVYKDSSEPIHELSCAEPNSLHGLMHLTREVMLKSISNVKLAIVRPTLVYGISDPHNGYGPNRFLRAAIDNNEIILFGNGEERRDHVAVYDIARLVLNIILHCSKGIVNATSGNVASFDELANYCISQLGSKSTIKYLPRIGQMPHNGYRPFAPSVALNAFPSFQFTHWRKGIADDCAAIKNI